ncbi:MAG: PAS domain S-box protein [Deltaproteobacteria bacterium]|nr:PAS domain S-box protein [Deltaproteobacteria bacterium]
MEKNLRHLNSVLYALRKIHRLIIVEKNRDRLIQGICDNLAVTSGYYCVWMVLVDGAGRYMNSTGSGLGEEFRSLRTLLKKNQFVPCAQKSLARGDVVLTKNSCTACGACPLAGHYGTNAAMTVRMKHKDRTYGVLTVIVSGESMDNPEEYGLLQEIAEDIAFALHNFDMEEAHRLSEEALKKSEKRYLALVENINEVIYTVDEKGMITYVSPRVEILGGYAPSELVGKFFLDFIYKEDVAGRAEQFQKVVSGVDEASEYRYVTKTGAVQWIKTSGRAIFKKGRVVGVQGVLTDITDLKRVEKNLKESEQRYKTLFQVTPAATAIIENDMTLSMVNTQFERLCGYSREEIEGKKKWVEFVVPTDLERMREYHGQRRGDPDSAPGEYEFHFINRHKEVKNIALNVAVIPGTGKSIAALVDITGMKQVEKRLQQAQKMESIGTLAGGIAHDFNNILAGMLGYTQLAMLGLPKSSQVYTNLENIIGAGRRGRDLIKQILSFSRHQTPRTEPVLLRPIIKEIVKLLGATLPSTIEIRQILKGDQEYVMANATKIHQILTNLCTNAGYAMQENGGILELKTDIVEIGSEAGGFNFNLTPGKYLKITVSDTGCGIDPEILDKIFEPYFTTKPHGQGNGLGLAVARGIAAGCGGTITVYSEPEKGTTFNVYLPVVEKNKVRIDKGKPVVGHRHGRILFVDDEPTLVDTSRQILEHSGYDVTGLTSSIEALDLFRKQPDAFDLVIADMTMPAMTGDKLAREIMRIRPGFPVVICSGFSKQLVSRSAGDIGVRAILMKPLLDNELISVIDEILSKKNYSE